MFTKMEQSNKANSKRIAKNTLLLYIRLIFTMAVGLFTSRVILATLGVDDYGVYNVVAGQRSVPISGLWKILGNLMYICCLE